MESTSNPADPRPRRRGVGWAVAVVLLSILLVVEAAILIFGLAFASAMGSDARWSVIWVVFFIPIVMLGVLIGFVAARRWRPAAAWLGLAVIGLQFVAGVGLSGESCSDAELALMEAIEHVEGVTPETRPHPYTGGAHSCVGTIVTALEINEIADHYDAVLSDRGWSVRRGDGDMFLTAQRAPGEELRLQVLRPPVVETESIEIELFAPDP